MKNQSRHDDTKLLLTIAAVIVTGAAGIALIAGIGSDETTDAPRRVARVPVAAAPAPAPVDDPSPAPQDEGEFALVANFSPSGDDTLVEQEESTVEVASPETPPLTFAPGENLVAGGLAAWEARDYARAAAYFEAQVEARDTDAWSWYMVGLARWKNGESEAASSAMRASAERDPASVKARINLARIENDRGDFTAALEAADEALGLFPTHPEALFLRGRSLYNGGRIDAAVEALEASLVGDTDNGYAHNLLGLIRIEQQSFEAATDALEIAAQLEPDVAFIQNNFGMALERVAERDAAIAAYRRAVELDPQHPKAASNLARLDPTAGDVEDLPVPTGDEPTTSTVAGIEGAVSPTPEEDAVDPEPVATEVADAGGIGGGE